MTSRFIAGSAVLLIASAAGAQDRVTQELIAQERVAAAAAAERRATEVHAQVQGGGRGGTVSPARVPLETKVVKGAPYSAEVVTESTQVLADGNRIIRRTTGRVYRDSQGRTRRENDVEPGRVGLISVTDPVAGIAFSLDPEPKIAWKTSGAATGVLAAKIRTADPAEVERRQKVEEEMVAAARGGGRGWTAVQPKPVPSPAPAPTPVVSMGHVSSGWDEKTEKLAPRNIEGVMADGTRTTRTIPAGAIGNEQPIVSVTEEWRSPELQVLVLTRTSDPRTGESVYKLQNITRAEPNASWFEVPADYTVRESGIRKLMPSIK